MLRYCWFRLQWLVRTRRIAQIICVLVLLMLTWCIHTISQNDKHDLPDWVDPAWMQQPPTCQSTHIKPFRVGCPASCNRAIGDETMYRMNAAWYFGQSIVLRDLELPVAYDMGINYQCPRQYVENFVNASKRLGDEVKAKIPLINLTIKPQSRIHMSLAYLCCLRKNETKMVQEILHDWVKGLSPFDFTVKFDKLECWHERYNSITNIMVGDDVTQRVVMRYVHDLYRTLTRRGIPIEIVREEQMPIHVTLVGIHHGEGEGKAPENDIRPVIPEIYAIVSNISKDYGDSWVGQGRLRVTHDPRYSDKGKWHAGAKP